MKRRRCKIVSRKGKISRLPFEVRSEINRRLLDGQTGLEILAWLNALPIAKERFGSMFEGKPINRSNLSKWRLGGYQDWLRERGIESGKRTD